MLMCGISDGLVNGAGGEVSMWLPIITVRSLLKRGLTIAELA